MVEAFDRAAVRAHEASASGELVEVAPDGDVRDVELAGKIFDGGPLVRVEHFEDPSTPFFDEQSCHGGRTGEAAMCGPAHRCCAVG